LLAVDTSRAAVAGEAIDYLPSQDASIASRFPEIMPEQVAATTVPAKEGHDILSTIPGSAQVAQPSCRLGGV
jgi:hypothetical protein